jgi:hypothetical protein
MTMRACCGAHKICGKKIRIADQTRRKTSTTTKCFAENASKGIRTQKTDEKNAEIKKTLEKGDYLQG